MDPDRAWNIVRDVLDRVFGKDNEHGQNRFLLGIVKVINKRAKYLVLHKTSSYSASQH